VLDYFGRVDIVVNNAGVYFTGRIDEPDRDQAAFDRRYIFLQCLSGYYVA
jgi:NADP-dependent 3-hydroxy acid dehydrogenase YdfG